MMSVLKPAAVLLLLFTLLTGVVYPLAVSSVAQVFFPAQANGSLILAKERIVGSSLIGQAFDDPRYFWSRPSATSPTPYNAAASTGSNLGPTNPALHQAVRERAAALRALDAEHAAQPIPVDLVTASGSGLDPHISPSAALYQVPRVARARGLDQQRVRALVEANIEDRTLGLLGEPRVNVLILNLALDAIAQHNT